MSARTQRTLLSEAIMGTCKKFADECHADYAIYRGKCKASARGDGVHELWVKLAWRNRQQARQWLSQVA